MIGKLAVVADNKASPVPARATLAEAIQNHARADKELKALRSAADRAREMVEVAEDRLVKATEVLAGERDKQTQRAIEAASTGLAMASSTGLREARIAEAEAQDVLQAARDALAKLEGSLDYGSNHRGESFDPATLALNHLRFEADATLRNEIPISAMITEAQSLQAHLAGKRSVLIYLLKQGLVPEEQQRAVLDLVAWKNHLPSLYEDRNNRFESDVAVEPHRCTPNDFDGAHPALRPWIEAREALARDANATLPASVSA